MSSYLLIFHHHLILFCLSMTVIFAKPALRILMGRDAEDDEFPYIVQLEQHLTFKNSSLTFVIPVCTASVLKPTWTLTAAHCVVSEQMKRLHFNRAPRFKTSNQIILQEKLILRQRYFKGPSLKNILTLVLHFVVHPLKKITSFEDIALLKHNSMIITRYVKISAIDFTSLYGHEVVIAGFGLTNVSNVVDLTFALNRPLQVLDKAMLKKCDTELQGTEFPSLCIATPCGQKAAICPGDSGGPILHPSGIVGVVSRGPYLNCDLRYNGVLDKNIVIATPVSPFVNWLSDIAVDE